MKYGFGVDLGGTTVKIAYFDETGNMLHKWEIPTDLREQGKNILPDIASSLLGYIKENTIPENLMASLQARIIAGMDNSAGGMTSSRQYEIPFTP